MTAKNSKTSLPQKKTILKKLYLYLLFALILIIPVTTICFIFKLPYFLFNKNTSINTITPYILIYLIIVLHGYILINFVKNLSTKKKLNNFSKPLQIRCGFGYDVHQLKAGNFLTLCGVKIKHNKSLLSFSDGDVAIHALIDALLGASSKFDIGTHFPDNNEKYKNISSIKLLKKTYKLIETNNFKIGNIDITIVAQLPKLQPFIEHMRNNIALALNTSTNLINIKATTEEHLGFTGQQLGISAFCIAVLYK